MAKQDRKKKQRVRSPHSGVKVLMRERASGTIYLARWRDPDTGRPVETSLTKLKRTTEQSRRAWAINKSNALAERKAALASGTAVITCTSPADAVSDYFEARKADLKHSTVTAYREATGPFLQWSHRIGLACIEDLTPAKLTAFRDWFTSRPAYVPLTGKGKGRGARKAGKRRRSPAQVNKCLRALRTFLSYVRKRELTPALTSDSIRDHLESAKVPKKLVRYLKQPEIRKLLKACERHDTELNDGKGHARERIGPFLVTVLLSGMRVAEAEGLRWQDIDLEAGEITLQHDATKTGHARRITLRETPELAALLANMKLRAGERNYVFGEVKPRKSPEAPSKALREHPEPGTMPFPHHVAESARSRLQREYGAPAFSWHDLRRTTGTFLTCAPSIFGAASAFLSARRLGHSVTVAEKSFLGAVTISGDARFLEDAMGCADLCKGIARSSKAKRTTSAS